MKGSGKNFNNDFEEAWQQALEGAEVTPPDAVWERIDSKLLIAESLRYKQYYIFYRSVAAACLLLLFSIGTWAYFNFQEKQVVDKQIADVTHTAPGQVNPAAQAPLVPIPFRPSATVPGFQQPGVNTDAEASNQTQQAANMLPVPYGTGKLADPGKQAVAATSEDLATTPTRRRDDNGNPATSELAGTDPFTTTMQRTIPELAMDEEMVTGEVFASEAGRIDQELNNFYLEALPRALGLIDVQATNAMALPAAYIPDNQHLMRPLASKHQAPQKNKSVDLSNRARFYASLNLQSDFFQPNFQMSQSMQQPALINNFNMSQAGNTRVLAVNEQLGMVHQPVPSFTYGMHMGMRLTNNLILEGGLAYANFNTNTATQAVVKNMEGTDLRPITIAHTNLPRMDESAMLDLQTTHQLNNTFEFASLPLRAGYVISARNIHFILKAGVATDFFIRSELSSSAERDFFDPMTQVPGEQSPFRRVFWNGSVGNEINYSLNRNYSFSLEANYRFAMQPLTKSGEAFSSLPESYGIGMILRYHFN